LVDDDVEEMSDAVDVVLVVLVVSIEVRVMSVSTYEAMSM